MSLLNYRKLELDNGLVVALQNTETQTISGRLRVFHGALHENKDEEGLAHFLEHVIMTGGTEKYSPEETDIIRERFGYFNASTSKDNTEFPVNMLAEDLELYLNFVSELAFCPRFDETRINEERKRVLREISDRKSRPSFKDERLYSESLYGINSPHVYFVLGSEEVVANASSDVFRNFHGRGYNPNNMDLILVGNLPSNIEELIIEKFGNKPKGNGKKFEFPPNEFLTKKIVLHTSAPELLNHENPNKSSGYVNLGIKAPTYEDNDSYAVRFLIEILGGNSNSRLFKTLSQRKGLAYGISSSYDNRNNQGNIQTYGGIDISKLDEAIDTIFIEMGKLKTEPVSEEELESCRRDVYYGIATVFETNEGRASAIEIHLDKNKTPEDFINNINAVTAEQIMKAANDYLPEKETGNYVLLIRDPLK